MAVKKSPADPFGGLTGAKRDAYAAMLAILKRYGLESLAGAVMGYIKQGYTSDTIGILLPETDAYKKRFKGNAARLKKGLPVLGPAEYLAVEQSYRQILSAAGLPKGFYDSVDDFTEWISADVSPLEIQARVKTATEMVNNIDTETSQAFRAFYSTGDMVAYALDRVRATTVLERQWLAAQAGGSATEQGLAIGRDTAEQIAETGITRAQQRAGFGQVAQFTRVTDKLADIYGGNYTQADAIEETFFDNAPAQEKRRRLASQERGTFGGSAATDGRALTSRKSGQV